MGTDKRSSTPDRGLLEILKAFEKALRKKPARYYNRRVLNLGVWDECDGGGICVAETKIKPHQLAAIIKALQ